MNTHSAIPERLPVSTIRADGGTQSRAQLYRSIVSDYAGLIAGGAVFPPIIGFHDGSDYWLADGFHRHAAHISLGLAEIDVVIRQGALRDAILYSWVLIRATVCAAPMRTKRRAVLKLLNDQEWGPVAGYGCCQPMRRGPKLRSQNAWRSHLYSECK